MNNSYHPCIYLYAVLCILMNSNRMSNFHGLAQKPFFIWLHTLAETHQVVSNPPRIRVQPFSKILRSSPRGILFFLHFLKLHYCLLFLSLSRLIWPPLPNRILMRTKRIKTAKFCTYIKIKLIHILCAFLFALCVGYARYVYEHLFVFFLFYFFLKRRQVFLRCRMIPLLKKT